MKLVDTLIKIKQNQGVSSDNMSTPQAPELVPPLTLILPWCFGALMLPEGFEAGKLNALRLLCTITLNCDAKHRSYLPQFYRFLHSGEESFVFDLQNFIIYVKMVFSINGHIQTVSKHVSQAFRAPFFVLAIARFDSASFGSGARM